MFMDACNPVVRSKCDLINKLCILFTLFRGCWWLQQSKLVMEYKFNYGSAFSISCLHFQVFCKSKLASLWREFHYKEIDDLKINHEEKFHMRQTHFVTIAQDENIENKRLHEISQERNQASAFPYESWISFRNLRCIVNTVG